MQSSSHSRHTKLLNYRAMQILTQTTHSDAEYEWQLLFNPVEH